MRHIWHFEELSKDLLSAVGGKNANLGEMIRSGIRVPPGFAITTDCYTQFIEQAGIRDKIFKILFHADLSDGRSLHGASSEIRSLIEGARIPDDIQVAIGEGYVSLCDHCGKKNLPVAIRSSATAEDTSTASFAGQQDTYLWVKGFEPVLNRVRKCWASLFTPRAISYRAKNDFPHEKVHMSVGVQKMVNSRTAGVMFTLNPVNGDLSKIVIEGSWGLGEAVVSGCVTPDKFVVDKVIYNILDRFIGNKHTEYALDNKTRQILKCDVDSDRQKRACLSDEELILLAEIGKSIEKYFGHPQDIEWAFDRDIMPPDNLFILQSRPETVWSNKRAESMTKKGVSYMDYMADRFIEGW
jgi:pyruvate, water dikinase